MIYSHSTNKIIIRAVAALNKAIKAHNYYSVCSKFKVKNKVQFIANVVSAKIKLPSYWYQPKTRKQKLEAAQILWDSKINNHGFYEVNLRFVRPKKTLGYGAILSAAEQLGEFSWADLLLSIPHHAERISKAYTAWGKDCGYTKKAWRKDGSCKKQYVSFDSYANNYYNSYRAYFVRNRIITKVKGKRGIYTLTSNGKLLLSGMKQLDTMC
jgi:hypothetical protein